MYFCDIIVLLSYGSILQYTTARKEVFMSQDFKPCPNRANNKDFCTCSHTDCSRHGVCCQCVQFHLNQRQLPQCYVKAGVK